jgi:hypothetical protein
VSKEVLLFIVHSSTTISLLPIVIMLWYRKSLLKQSYGIAIFGMYVTFFLSALFSYISCYFLESSTPSYHIFVTLRGFFIYLLFIKELKNKFLKTIGIALLLSIFVAEFLELFYWGGLLSNNNLTQLFVNLEFIIFYILYIIDIYKNNPESMFEPRGVFPLYSVIFAYEVVFLLFSVIENDLREKLLIDPSAVAIWGGFVLLYSISLILASFLLWRNLSAFKKEFMTQNKIIEK